MDPSRCRKMTTSRASPPRRSSDSFYVSGKKYRRTDDDGVRNCCCCRVWTYRRRRSVHFGATQGDQSVSGKTPARGNRSLRDRINNGAGNRLLALSLFISLPLLAFTHMVSIGDRRCLLLRGSLMDLPLRFSLRNGHSLIVFQ